MALLVLIALGATIGWLSSVLTRSEALRAVLRQVGVGIAAAVVVGLIVNTGTFLGGLSLVALGAAVAAGVIALTLYHVIRNRRADA